MKNLRTLGMRHVALNVKDPQVSKEFYTKVLKMKTEWEPDEENVYMTSEGLDNVAFHKLSQPLTSTHDRLDHIGFFVPEPTDVDEWYEHVKACGAKIVKEIKTHRDGARSFYFSDPDQIVIQVLYHSAILKGSTP